MISLHAEIPVTTESRIDFGVVFEKLGFDRTADGYKFSIDATDFTLIRGLNDRLVDCYSLIGSFIQLRTASFVEYSLPLQVESHAHGLAFLAYPLRNIPFQRPPVWLEEGRTSSRLLPWEIERSAYGKRPSCLVERDWMKLAARRLRDLAERSAATSRTTFEFDGESLRIATDTDIFHITAGGIAWPGAVTIATTDLRMLPKRWMNPTIGVSVWKERLTIGRLSISLSDVHVGKDQIGDSALQS